MTPAPLTAAAAARTLTFTSARERTPMDHHRLVFQHDQLHATAVAAAVAARTLTDQVTRASSGSVPASTCYELASTLKDLLDDVARTVAALPAGLATSLRDPDIVVVDVDVVSSEPRDPEESVHLATDALLTAAAAIRRAVRLLDEAQNELSGQGYLSAKAMVGAVR